MEGHAAGEGRCAPWEAGVCAIYLCLYGMEDGGSLFFFLMPMLQRRKMPLPHMHFYALPQPTLQHATTSSLPLVCCGRPAMCYAAMWDCWREVETCLPNKWEVEEENVAAERQQLPPCLLLLPYIPLFSVSLV